MIYTVIERAHSQLSFNTLIVKIGPQTAELHGIQVVHENGEKYVYMYMYTSMKI